MRFGPDWYVPVLKSKRGEKNALLEIAPHLRSRILPFIEIVERTEKKSLDAHLKTVFSGLGDCLSLYYKAFIDPKELVSDGEEAVESVFDMAASEGIRFTPVYGLSLPIDVESYLEYMDDGIAVRLTRSELKAGDIARKIERFIYDHDIRHSEVDLILDLGAVEELVPEGVFALSDEFIRAIPNIEMWRSFTISGCAFPQSMRVVSSNSHIFIDRSEWISWKDMLHANIDSYKRFPTFSDAGIQHPSGVEGFNPLFMQVSSTIRYVYEDSWLLIKGESTRTTPARIQFPRLARKLVRGELSEYFYGGDHCTGCAQIQEAADGVKGYGSAEKWRKLGTVHHITHVAQSIAALPFA